MFSCASGVTVESKFCRSNGHWASLDDKLPSEIEMQVRGFGDQLLNIKSALADKGVKCGNMKRMRVIIYQSGPDVLLGIIPGFSSHKVLVQYR